MNYQTLAQTILYTLPPSQLRPIQRFHESDDEKIARVVWRRMQLEMGLDRPSIKPTLLV